MDSKYQQMNGAISVADKIRTIFVGPLKQSIIENPVPFFEKVRDEFDNVAF